MSYPTWAETSPAPGYQTLKSLIPRGMYLPEKFWLNIGTAMLLLLLARSDPAVSVWRHVLNSSLAQYLGKISFALYLIHGPVLHAVGYMVPHYVWWSLGVEGVKTNDFTWGVGMVVGWSVGLALCLWLADVWQREVENRCMKLVKRLEEYCFVKV
jgi:peptidoglycan/LPS O-acetylase OafA/YrhL